MRLSILRMLRSIDDYGHPIGVTYKGQESYQSAAGGFLSLFVLVFTAVMAGSTLVEVFSMNEPKVNQYIKPLSTNDREEIGAVNFEEYGYILALRFEAPPEVGQIYAKHSFNEPAIDDPESSERSEDIIIPLIDCRDIMPDEVIYNSAPSENEAVLSGSLKCLDPKMATLYSFLDHSYDARKQKKVWIEFKYCLDAEPIEGVDC